MPAFLFDRNIIDTDYVLAAPCKTAFHVHEHTITNCVSHLTINKVSMATISHWFYKDGNAFPWFTLLSNYLCVSITQVAVAFSIVAAARDDNIA